MNTRTFVLLGLLAAGTAQAQLKPPSDGKSTSPNTPAAGAPTAPVNSQPSTVSPVTEAKQEAAVQHAEAWLKLIDKGEYGKAWDECGSLFRDRVTRQQWVEGLPKDRVSLGTLKSRKLDAVTYRTTMPNAPDGEYVMARFFADYENKPKVEEVVSLMYVDGTWRPIGYGMR
jgi:hypothetical protein